MRRWPDTGQPSLVGHQAAETADVTAEYACTQLARDWFYIRNRR
jgi:hypothetical protein